MVMQTSDGLWLLGDQTPIDPAAANLPPDCGSLAFWRTALDLWMRDDGQGGKVSRLTDVDNAIKTLENAVEADGNTPDPVKRNLGTLARQQFEYANGATRAQLTAEIPGLGPFYQIFGFTAADADESLWRANQIALGDIRGVWPLPAPAASPSAEQSTPDQPAADQSATAQPAS